MKIINTTPALDFNTLTSERIPFTLSRCKGNKIILSFYRNGDCPISNYRLHCLKQYRDLLAANNMISISVFESMPKNILPFAGRSAAPFYILADPMALLYDLYKVKTNEEKIKAQIADGSFSRIIAIIKKKGFTHFSQESYNCFRMPADFLIDENFIISTARYGTSLTDYLSINKILKWNTTAMPVKKEIRRPSPEMVTA